MTLTLTLRRRLVFVLLLAFTPVFIYSLVFRGQLAGFARASGEQAALQIAHTAAAAHEEAVTETRATLEVLAQVTGIRANPANACGEVMARIVEARRYYTVLGAIDREGWAICTVPPTGDPVYLGDRRYVAEAFERGEFTLGGYQRARISGRPTLTVATPVLGLDGEVTHLLAAGLDLAYLAGAYTGGADAPDLTVVIFDREGSILSRSGYAELDPGEHVDPGLLTEALASRDGALVGRGVDTDGVERTFAVVPLSPHRTDQPAEAFLAVGFDSGVTGQEVERILLTNLLWLAVALLVAVAGVGLLVDRFLFGRLTEVAAAAERLGRGDLDARARVTSEGDEVDRLATVFNAMASNIQEFSEAEARWARDEIRAREERFRQMADHIDGVFWMRDPASGQTLYVSPPVERIWGRNASEFLGRGTGFVESLHPEDRDQALEVFGSNRTAEVEVEYRIIRPDGAVRWIRDRSFTIPGADGAVYRMGGFAEDITEERRLGEELRHSQRLEAVGRLAGGVAHDFNNILTTILGNAQILLETLPEGSPEREEVGEILTGAGRAAQLTGQLLAFSRKQLVQPRAVDLNEVIDGMATMLRKAVTEHVTLTIRPAPELRLAWVDPGQAEQILLNLAVNARDAMPKGGELIIETGNVRLDREYAEAHLGRVESGEYVCLTVSDTGVGIPREIRDHIFEPFFTTKAVGEGTGLGLATVYGIVKQSGGYIWAYSEVGEGTVFRIYLPIHDAPATGAGGHEEGAGDEEETHAEGVDLLLSEEEAPLGGERILLLEDEEAVRQVLRQSLTRSGYSVRPAAGRDELTRVLDEPDEDGNPWIPDLLISDVVLAGGEHGPELAREMTERFSGLRVLFISGYTGESATGKRWIDPDTPFLQKPFTADTLRRALREALVADPPAWSTRGAPS